MSSPLCHELSGPMQPCNRVSPSHSLNSHMLTCINSTRCSIHFAARSTSTTLSSALSLSLNLCVSLPFFSTRLGKFIYLSPTSLSLTSTDVRASNIKYVCMGAGCRVPCHECHARHTFSARHPSITSSPCSTSTSSTVVVVA
ncbi:uncharacterized protein BO80DRAFT_67458 [Aspergillus ibericus CBS 121593]|uniref:Uncharacterized protein n=1 Tax=Aspergillus ibericus CBS 121593 TaxID=1448316 RepID=A0A395H0R4_9EURO|nr:hypothetical protein BO80DRAFT_67458 [Aspergillus ibericus CBS 121593]RAL01396.1 hypothetical protein BO80DRAFT_67458 [Aspergillus ibericus CBS 121593]